MKLLVRNGGEQGFKDLETRDFKVYEEEFGIKVNKDNAGNILINNREDLDNIITILQKECVVEVSTREKFFSKSKIKALKPVA